MMQTPALVATRTGPKALFRPKVRQPVSVLLTAPGHVALAKHLRRTGLSRSDFVEALLTQFGDKVVIETPLRPA